MEDETENDAKDDVADEELEGEGNADSDREEEIVIPPIVDNGDFENVQVDGNDLGEDDYTIDEGGNLVISPEYIATLSNGEHTIRVETGGEVYETTLVVDDGVPLSMGEFHIIEGSWSLFDLIMTIAAVVLAIGYAVVRARRREDEDEMEDSEEEEEQKRKRRILTSVTLALLGIFNIILFLLTQDMKQPMSIFDIYSVVFAIVVIVQVVIMFFIRKKSSDDEEDGRIASKA